MNKTRITVAALAVSAAALVGIATHEGYRGEAYRDAAGIPTIGYGETAGVKMGDKITPERALVQLLESTEKHADAIRQCIHVPLYQHEFDAYVSLSYQIGAGAFCRSTLIKSSTKAITQGRVTSLINGYMLAEKTSWNCKKTSKRKRNVSRNKK